MLLFRKIDETRWLGKEFLESTSVTELNTKDNKLSVWMNDGKVSEMDLGLAFILTQSCFKTICCVKIPDEMLKAKKLELEPENSSTPFIAMRPYHANVLVPTVLELSDFAEIIYELVKDQDTNCKFFSETDLKVHFYQTLIKNAIEIDFSIKTNQAKWDVVRETEKSFNSKIDFTKLDKVKPRTK